MSNLVRKTSLPCYMATDGETRRKNTEKRMYALSDGGKTMYEL